MDIVKRLRYWPPLDRGGNTGFEDRQEAADEIEALRDKLAEAERKVKERGAQMGVMRKAMDVSEKTLWSRFCANRPGASDWFDETGEPK